MNPFLANLLQRIGPQLARMPQFNSQWGGQMPPMHGLFGGNPQAANMMQLFQPRRANMNPSAQMPQINPAQLTPALQNMPQYAPRPQAAAPAPAAPARSWMDMVRANAQAQTWDQGQS